MKLLLNIFIILVFVLSCTYLSAQNRNSEGLIEAANNQNLAQVGISTFDSRDRTIDGSVFLFDDWEKGSIVLNNGKELTLEMFNYNLEANQLVVVLEGKKMALPLVEFQLFKTNKVSKTTFQEEVRNFKRIVDQKRAIRLYEQLIDGDYALYRSYDIEVKKANYNPAVDVGTVKDQLVKKEIFVLQYEDQFYVVPKSRKKAIKEFSQIKRVSSYLQKNKLNLKEEADLIALFDYLNK